MMLQRRGLEFVKSKVQKEQRKVMRINRDKNPKYARCSLAKWGGFWISPQATFQGKIGRKRAVKNPPFSQDLLASRVRECIPDNVDLEADIFAGVNVND